MRMLFSSSAASWIVLTVTLFHCNVKVSSTTCPPVEEGQPYQLVCQVSNDTVNQIIFKPFVHNNFVEAVICVKSQAPYCINATSYYLGTSSPTEPTEPGFEVNITIPKINRTSQVHSTSFQCLSQNFTSQHVIYECDSLPVFVRPTASTSRCSYEFVNNNVDLSVTCSTDKIFPEAACRFKRQTINGGPMQDVTELPVYESVITSQDPDYYRSECTVVIAMSTLGAVPNSFVVDIFPNVTIGSNYGVTASTPFVNFTSQELYKDENEHSIKSTGSSALLSLDIQGIPAPVRYTLQRDDVNVATVTTSTGNAEFRPYEFRYYGENPPYGRLELSFRDLRERDFTNYTLTVDNGIGQAMTFKFHVEIGREIKSTETSLTGIIVGTLAGVSVLLMIVAVIVILKRKGTLNKFGRGRQKTTEDNSSQVQSRHHRKGQMYNLKPGQQTRESTLSYTPSATDDTGSESVYENVTDDTSAGEDNAQASHYETIPDYAVEDASSHIRDSEVPRASGYRTEDASYENTL